MTLSEKCFQTFDSTLTISAPCYDLTHDLAVSVDDKHGSPRVWQVWYAFVADDRNEFCPRILCCEFTDMFDCAVISKGAKVNRQIWTFGNKHIIADPGWYRKQTTAVPGTVLPSPWEILLASVTSRV